MAEALRSSPAGPSGGGELAWRIGSTLVLAPLTIAIAYWGGWLFVAFWTVAAAGVFVEWTTLVARSNRGPVLVAGLASIVLALLLAGSIEVSGPAVRGTRLLAAVVVMAMGTVACAAVTATGRRSWAAAGVPYAGVLGLAPIILRSDDERGFGAMILLFAIVWMTDIFAYFVGRAVGGPRLMARISPNKTWSGALGGVAGAIAAATGLAALVGFGGLTGIAIMAGVLSIAAQAGDLFESAVKRRFGAKDSSRIIPGHGGLMDRLDGFLAAAALAVIVGLWRGGFDAPARGFLIW